MFLQPVSISLNLVQKFFVQDVKSTLYFGKEINAKIFFSAFLTTQLSRLLTLYHPRAHKCAPNQDHKMKSSFLSKSIHRCGLAACGHCKEVTLSPHFLYKPAAEKREESRKETLIDKCDKKSKTTGKKE